MIIKKEVYINNENGETVLSHVEEIEVNEPTNEQLLAEKEAELLRIYQEIQILKENQI